MSELPTVLITGGAVRLGRELALGLAKHGYSIALHYHSHTNEAADLIQTIQDLGVKCQGFAYDLADPIGAGALIDDVKSKMPNLQIVINNAAIIKQGALLDTKPEDYDALFALNLKAPFFITQAFARQCKEGQVINILDTYITKKRTPYFSYLITKKALAAFTEMAAFELAPTIRVNAICPGLVIPANAKDKEFHERKQHQLPLQVLPVPANIVQAAVMLLNASFLTGHTLFVDGGEHLM